MDMGAEAGTALEVWEEEEGTASPDGGSEQAMV